MEKVKAILFDKDGTLMDFHSIWIKVAEELVAECISLYHLPSTIGQTLLEEIGVEGAFVNPRSAIAAGTSLDVAKGLCNYIESAREEEMHHWVSEKLFSLMYEHRSHMKMTADDFAPTELFLKQYKLENFFDYIIASDTFLAQKPDKKIIEVFCEKFNLESCEVAVVGDTPTDLHLAKNGGDCYAIGVLSGTGDRPTLEPLADLVLDSVGEFISQSGEFFWEKEKSNV
ncbi:HAD family hydrolase [Bacillus sp. BB56-3]|uniref:HAD family hydrolase n=1 Tax=Bacillus sp. BB56-3 TaxID=2217831 RepID=UPI0011EBD3CE|nr:HAD family hydrolase [Bacillus sp. BB56-3]KAA0787827.1 HAD family hydrolase [Bacillus sp. BB56-3]